MIDSHLHLDCYSNEEIVEMMRSTGQIEAIVTVSNDLPSCQRNLLLSQRFTKVKPSFGFHPEQRLLTEQGFNELLAWMEKHRQYAVAIGEVGLPYYLKKSGKVTEVQYGDYKERLEVFIKIAKRWDKPIALHAVYEDADVVCDLLEAYSLRKAHFHWLKGEEKTVARIAANGYFISIPPEIVYKKKIQKLGQTYPIEQIMVETDGPWPFEGPFSGKRTHPLMMEQSLRTIASLKKLPEEEVAKIILTNTKNFYSL